MSNTAAVDGIQFCSTSKILISFLDSLRLVRGIKVTNCSTKTAVTQSSENDCQGEALPESDTESAAGTIDDDEKFKDSTNAVYPTSEAFIKPSSDDNVSTTASKIFDFIFPLIINTIIRPEQWTCRNLLSISLEFSNHSNRMNSNADQLGDATCQIEQLQSAVTEF